MMWYSVKLLSVLMWTSMSLMVVLMNR